MNTSELLILYYLLKNLRQTESVAELMMGEEVDEAIAMVERDLKKAEEDE